MKSQEMLETIIKAADSKKAEDIVALEMQEVSLLADYFVVLTGHSQRQIGAIIDAIEEAMEAAGIRVKKIEGQKASSWILMDYGDIVVNAFMPEERELYQLEKLWSQAPIVDLSDWIDG